jgi:hypothetical protein
LDEKISPQEGVSPFGFRLGGLSEEKISRIEKKESSPFPPPLIDQR